MFSAIIGPISSLAGTWLEGRVNKAKAETDVTSTPQWFSTCLYICIGSSFGYRFGKTGLQLMNKKKQ